MINNLSNDLLQKINEAVQILKQGGIIAYPTDTVYSVGTNALDQKAVDRVFKVKGRSYSKPLPVLIAHEDQLPTVVRSISGMAKFLMQSFWPGALTMVLLKSDLLPSNVTAGADTVGIRMPNHIVPLTIIEMLGLPIIGTSANISGKRSTLTAEEARTQLGGCVDLVVDGGKCPVGIESTIVDLTVDMPKILRKGAIPEGKIYQVIEEFIKRGELKCE